MADNVVLNTGYGGDFLCLSEDSRLMVCLCDLSADDMVSFLSGLVVNHCTEHKAIKLESMMKVNTAISFAGKDANGDFHPVSLQEAIDRTCNPSVVVQ